MSKEKKKVIKAQEFKADLKALLEKYEVYLAAHVVPGDNGLGIDNEKFSVFDNDTDEELDCLNDGHPHVTAEDLVGIN